MPSGGGSPGSLIMAPTLMWLPSLQRCVCNLVSFHFHVFPYSLGCGATCDSSEQAQVYVVTSSVLLCCFHCLQPGMSWLLSILTRLLSFRNVFPTLGILDTARDSKNVFLHWAHVLVVIEAFSSVAATDVAATTSAEPHLLSYIC